MPTNWEDDDVLRPGARRHLERMQPAEDGDGLTSAKNQVGVVFIDERGKMLALQYHSLLFAEPTADGIEVTFTTHKVTMTGYKLANPVQASLLMLLTLHKRSIVKATPGGKERDFGPDGDGWQVVSMTWERVEG